jgi:3-oxoacyl-[acyl-carrier protein] reductase
MDLGLSGKCVLVAGASQGIGYGMATGFLNEGANVVLTGRTQSKLDAAREELSKIAGADHVHSIAGDMTASEGIANALDAAENTFDLPDCVICNVGIGQAPPGYDVSDEDWDADIRQNLTGSMFLARDYLKRVLADGAPDKDDPNIIFVSSIAGANALQTSLPYNATKAGIILTARSLAKQVGKRGVRVNTIVPGNIRFDDGGWDLRYKARPEAWQRWLNREVAMRRFGEVDEIADATVWLASKRASFVTGAQIVVDGGQLY